MTPQQDAAEALVQALLRHKMGAAMASSSHGYTVYVQEHPEAKVMFGFDQLGGVSVQYEFDGRHAAVPKGATIEALAQELVSRIAGSGGGRGPA